MTGGAPNDRLARLIDEAGFKTRKSFARAVKAESDRAGDPLLFCDHTYVTRWLDGRVPNGKTPMFIAAALSRALRRQITPGDIGMPFAGHLPTINLGLAYPNTSTDAAGNVALLWRADLDEAAVLHRGRVDPGAWNDASLRWLVDPARPPGDLSKRAPRIGLADVERFRVTADTFAQLDNRYGGGHARQALIRYLSDDGERLLRGQYTEPVGRALFSAVGEATLLAAWMAYDSAPTSGLAQRYFITSFRRWPWLRRGMTGYSARASSMR